MSVFLSPVGGAGAQFFDNNGNPLTGGKLYTYAAGTTTPQATYTSAAGSTFHTNPIVLDAAGRVPGSSEIWLADNQIYKFVLKDSNDVLLATWDQITGVNSNFVNYTTETEVQTATAGQTVFTLTTMSYAPGTGSLTVYVDGVNQYEGDSYVETNSTTVTFTAGLHVGALVKFTTAVQTTGNATDASVVSYTAPYTGAVAYTVEDKLAQTVSVMDFGAVGDGVTDDTAAIQAALNYLAGANGGTLVFPGGHVFALSDVGGMPRPVGPGAGPVPAGLQPTKFTVSNVNDLTLTGGGKLKLLRTASGGGTYDAYNWNFFQFNTCSRIKIYGLSFEGNRTIPAADINYNGEQGEVFRLNACTDVQITGNYFTLVSITSIRVMANSQRIVIDENIAYDGNDCFVQVGDAASPTVADDPRNVVISNNVIDQFYTDAGIKVRYSAHNVVIDGNDIIAYQGGATQNPPALMIRGKNDSDDRVTDIIVSNNRMESVGVVAVSMSDAFASNGRYPKNVTFIGNSIKGGMTLKGTNIRVESNIIEGIVEHILAADIDVSGNLITYSAGGSSRALSLGTAGDYAASARGNRIVTNGTGHSVYCENITRVSICDNVIEKNGTTTGSSNQLEIYVPANGDAVISGNQFFQASSFRLGSCIRVNGQGADSAVTITANTFRNAGAYSIRRVSGLSGAGVVVANTSVGATIGNYLDSTGTYTTTGNTF